METLDVSFIPNIKLDLSLANQAPKPIITSKFNPGSSYHKPQILASHLPNLRSENTNSQLLKSLDYSSASVSFLSQTPMLRSSNSPFMCLLSTFFLHSFSPTPKSQFTAMDSKITEIMVNNHVSFLSEAFESKLKFSSPISKTASAPSQIWQDLEKKGEKFLAIKILTDELVSQNLAFDAIQQSLHRITKEVKLTKSKNLILVDKFGEVFQLLAFIILSHLILRNKFLIVKIIVHLSVASKSGREIKSQSLFSPEIRTSPEKSNEKEFLNSESSRGRSTNSLSSYFDPSEQSLSSGTEPSSLLSKVSISNKGRKSIEDIDVRGQFRPLEVEPPSGTALARQAQAFGSDGLKLLPPRADGEYALQRNGMTSKGLGPKLGESNPDNMVIPATIVEDTKVNSDNNQMGAENDADIAVAAEEKWQVSTESLQPAPKRQRPEEF